MEPLSIFHYICVWCCCSAVCFMVVHKHVVCVCVWGGVKILKSKTPRLKETMSRMTLWEATERRALEGKGKTKVCVQICVFNTPLLTSCQHFPLGNLPWHVKESSQYNISWREVCSMCNAADRNERRRNGDDFLMLNNESLVQLWIRPLELGLVPTGASC